MQVFYCEHCKQKFNDKGRKKTWNDPIYGSSWKFVADCSNCGEEVGEIKDALKAKNSGSGEVEPSSCATGMCPYASS